MNLMKNFSRRVVLLFVILAFLFSVSVERALSVECPFGHVAKTRTFGPDANGCEWEVVTCVACAVTHFDPTLLKVVSVTSTNGCDLADLDQSWLLIQLKLFLFNYCSSIKPCKDGCTRVSIQLPLCYKWHSKGWIDINNIYHFESWLEYCNDEKDNSYCEVNFGICVDNTTTPPTYIECIKQSKIPRNPACIAGEIPKPSAPFPNYIGEFYSVCFQHGCW
jgi:hypothetical protein